MLLLAIFVIAFGCGYGARELASRWRRFVERERFEGRRGRNFASSRSLIVPLA
jgi:hypothetical protein